MAPLATVRANTVLGDFPALAFLVFAREANTAAFHNNSLSDPTGSMDPLAPGAAPSDMVQAPSQACRRASASASASSASVRRQVGTSGSPADTRQFSTR